MSKPSTKSYVLQKLEQNKGSYITGMDLALELGVSRNAIWKAINELKKEGYIIHSTNNKGYSLDEGSDILSVTAIRECIESIINSATLSTTTSKEKNIAKTKTGNTLIDKIVDSIIIYDQLASTNQTAKMNFITGTLDKKIIIARSQTSGQGHDKSSFDSPEGGIYMSIILDKSEKISTSTVGNIVLDAIQELSGKNATIDKKYNRISIGKKNVCGILTEYFADLETNTINGYIIGIGIKDIDIPKNEAIGMILCKLAREHILSIN